MVDAQEQYSRRSCLVINGIATPGHEAGADNCKPVQIKVKLQSSLTRHRTGLLKLANCQFEGAKNVKIAYADLHGALKAMLNTPVKNKSIVEFKTKMEVMEVSNLADGLDEDTYEGIYEQ